MKHGMFWLTVVCCIALSLPAGEAWAQPRPDTCGRVSQFDMAPRNRQVYPVRVLAIDGRSPLSTSNNYRVAAGPHRVKVAELIDAEEFTNVQLRRRNTNRVAQAEIEFEVEPGYTYFVGAQSFLRSDRDAIAVQQRRGEYWAPVVYLRIAEACR